MSHLSDVGFGISSEEELSAVLDGALKIALDEGKEYMVKGGSYVCYHDVSGAEFWMQFNRKKVLIGGNPHYSGKSRLNVSVLFKIEREKTPLDGAFYAWMAPEDKNKPESGFYPFIFDVPDFKSLEKMKLPQNVDIQLTAFVEQMLDVYKDEDDFYNRHTGELKWGSRSFVPTGLFKVEDGEKLEETEEPYALFTGVIKEFELKTNRLTGQKFYWLLVETHGGEIDVVSDPKFFEKPPEINNVIQGHFWLSGRVLTDNLKKEKGIFKLFMN